VLFIDNVDAVQDNINYEFWEAFNKIHGGSTTTTTTTTTRGSFIHPFVALQLILASLI